MEFTWFVSSIICSFSFQGNAQGRLDVEANEFGRTSDDN